MEKTSMQASQVIEAVQKLKEEAQRSYDYNMEQAEDYCETVFKCIQKRDTFNALCIARSLLNFLQNAADSSHMRFEIDSILEDAGLV